MKASARVQCASIAASASVIPTMTTMPFEPLAEAFAECEATPGRLPAFIVLPKALARFPAAKAPKPEARVKHLPSDTKLSAVTLRKPHDRPRCFGPQAAGRPGSSIPSSPRRPTRLLSPVAALAWYSLHREERAEDEPFHQRRGAGKWRGARRKLVRAVMVANARFACNGSAGRNQGDPVFEEIVEGRQKWKGYSSCADLVHWCLRRAGFRDERVLNREDDDGAIPWRPSVNVSRLVYATGHAFSWWKSDSPLGLRPGDMALVGENGQEHVFVVAEVTDDLVTSYDYGQFFSGKHGGKRTVRHIHYGAGGRLHLYASQLPGRPFIGRLDPYELLLPHFLRNELAAAEVPDDFADGVSAPAPAARGNPLVTTREIQRALTELGYAPGPIDGVFGSKTRAAIMRFQADNGLIADGIVGKKTRAKMQERLSA